MGVQVILLDLVPLLSKATSDVLDSDPRVSSVEPTESLTSAHDLIERPGGHVVIFDPGAQRFQENPESIASFSSRVERAPVRTIALTDRTEPSLIVQCISQGIDSYLHVSVSPEDLVETVVDTWRGGRSWRVEQSRPRPRPTTPIALSPLSRREQEVFSLILQRMTNEEITERLMLAHQTVKNHVSSVLQKLGMQSRKQLIRRYNMRPTVPG